MKKGNNCKLEPLTTYLAPLDLQTDLQTIVDAVLAWIPGPIPSIPSQEKRAKSY